MKVVFWNGTSLSDDVTDYMAAIGTILSLEYNCEVVLGSNYISNHMLQDCFFSKIKEEGAAHAPYRFLYDSPEYYRVLWNMKRNRKDDILEVPMEGVTIVFPPDVAEKRLFYFKAPEAAFYLLDIAGGSNAALQSALEEADIIVILLPQDVVEIQNFFYQFSILIPKAIFVIKEKKRRDRRFYRKVISEYGISNRNIGSIPQNKEFIEACEDGKIEVFLRDNQSTKCPGYYITAGMKSIAKLLHEHGTMKN